MADRQEFGVMDSDTTVRETEGGAERTVREGEARETARESAAPVSSDVQTFRGYDLLQQLPTSGGESDIYVVGKGSDKFILKLYRYKIQPKVEVARKIMALSEAHPREVIRVFEFGFDETTQRWFEIQEYAQNGSLKRIVDNISGIGTEWQNAIFFFLLREISDSLKLLHENGILHLDLKPSNVLVRSWNPIDLVLIDFGISNTLDPELSRKFTAVRGTPMYQSPESWSGAVGEPSDWWSLGMLALEIAAGKHPFAGLSQQVVASLLMTKAIEIPETIPPDRREVLQGLLTRDTSRRWGYAQVSRWLKGERDIPVHFERPAAASAPAQQQIRDGAPRPLAFMGERHTGLGTLARAIAKDEASWDKGRELLLRGNIRAWLENNGEFERAVDLDLLVEGIQDPDEKLFRFVHRYGKPLPLLFMGRAITPGNLLLFLGRGLEGEDGSKAEAVFAEKICGGGLSSLLDFYLRHNESDGDLDELRRIFAGIQGETPRTVLGYLNAVAGVKKNMSAERFAELCEAGLMAEIETAILRAAKDKNGNTALMHVVSKDGNPEVATALLEAGADVDAANEYGVTALMAAVRNNGSLEIVRVLLAAGADVKAVYKGGGTALSLAAAFHGNPEIIDALLAAGADVDAVDEHGVTALIAAAQSNGNPAIVAALLAAGADVNAAEKASGETALMKVARENTNREIMAALLAARADVNATDKNGVTALMAAARNNDDPAVVKALLAAGADVDDIVYRSGVTALMTAAQSNDNPEITLALLRGGAYVNAMNTFGVTALMAAAQSNGNPEVIDALLAAGADVNAVDKQGATALMKAAQWGRNPEVIASLLAAGANAAIRDRMGKRAVDYAAQNTDLKETAVFRSLQTVS